MSPAVEPTGRLVLVRHGETEWSRSGQHTGSTDIPLTPDGERDARALGSRLAAFDLALVLASPLARARRTAELAGLHAERRPRPRRVGLRRLRGAHDGGDPRDARRPDLDGVRRRRRAG